ncbi:AMP-binding protein [Paenibacillus montanisoli]|uniref:acetate--CoA ligase n=1 Tax=Paenibacillus montanisoli TaxID=2081970 RepID=A0A328TZG3_9BACL|nr:AMP-binding protein [Paenibacillus montanisoli]RAP75937.1 AMP-dependent synthetase [Paenibacillus montanisoli]
MGLKPVWRPTKADMANTRLFRLMQQHGFDDYDAFYQMSIGDIAWFWEAVVQDMGIAWFRRYSQTVDLSAGIRWPSWFAGGRINAAYNAVDKWLKDPAVSRRTALIWEGEDGTSRSYTYRELAVQVDRAAYGLLRLGIRKGDRVAVYMPMIPETVMAMLAAAKLGAISVPVYSGYGADAAAKRLTGAGCKLVVTVDGFYRRGKPVLMKEEADHAVDASGCVTKVVVVRRLGCPISWRSEKDVDWAELTRSASRESPVAYPLRSSDPLMLLYTSGTTGAPKGIVHSHSGFPIKAAFDAGYAMDVRPGDVMLWITDMGWMMGPFLMYGTLLNAATMVLYEGAPDYPGPDCIFRQVQKHGVTHLGISPTLIRSLMKHGEACYRDCDLSSLRVIGSTGEPWNPEPWMWLFRDVGKERVPIVNYSGGTEISGGILGNVLLKPIAPAGFNSAIPGMHAEVYSAEGKPVRGEVGELVLKSPWLGMAGGFWQEPERYERTYWSRWPDIWVHGDWVQLDENGYWTITGRSDDTLNVAGKRLGPAELESLLVGHPQVVEAAVIGVPDEAKGEAAVCFVVPGNRQLPDEAASAAFVAELFKWIADRLGKAFKPNAIHLVQALPRTRNAKVMRRVIRAAYLAVDPGDLSALENPEAVDEIRSLAMRGNLGS